MPRNTQNRYGHESAVSRPSSFQFGGTITAILSSNTAGKAGADESTGLQKERVTSRLTENHSEVLDFQWDVVTD